MSKQLINSAYHVEHLKTVLDSAFHNKVKTKRVNLIIDSDGSISMLFSFSEFTVSIIYLIAQKKYRVSVLDNGKEVRFFFSDGAKLKTDIENNILSIINF